MRVQTWQKRSIFVFPNFDDWKKKNIVTEYSLLIFNFPHFGEISHQEKRCHRSMDQ